MCCEAIQSEKEAYQRLGHHDDIVTCLDLSGSGIRLELVENGQLIRFRAMTGALIHDHSRRVLLCDITAWNFLVLANLVLKLSGFDDLIILRLDTGTESACDGGDTIYTDMGQLGAFITVTTRGCEFDMYSGLPRHEPVDAVFRKMLDQGLVPQCVRAFGHLGLRHSAMYHLEQRLLPRCFQLFVH